VSADAVRVGVIGTGYLGRLHVRVLSEIPEADLVGFVETRDDVAAEIQQAFSIRRFGTVAELSNEIEAAVVATPTVSHADVATELLESGRHVMIEKPIAAKPEEAQKLIELAGRHRLIVQVGHVERYNPAIVAVAPHVGESRYVEAQRLGVFAGRSLDIDVLLDLMIHDLNLVLSLLASPVARIDAVGVPVLTDKVDIANVRLQLASGCVINLTASRVSSERVRKTRFFGRDSYISVDTKEQEVKGYRLVQAAGRERSIQPIDLALEKREPLRVELESFLECTRTGERPLVTGEDGLAALELAIAVGDALNESMVQWKGTS
jgi:predicted dehydrogenase